MSTIESDSDRKVRRGYVVSDSMDKTITIEVERVRQHPFYDKRLRRHSRFKAHDEHEVAKLGDFVEVEETRPLSKTKRWKLRRVLETGARPVPLTREEDPLESDSEGLDP